MLTEKKKNKEDTAAGKHRESGSLLITSGLGGCTAAPRQGNALRRVPTLPISPHQQGLEGHLLISKLLSSSPGQS